MVFFFILFLLSFFSVTFSIPSSLPTNFDQSFEQFPQYILQFGKERTGTTTQFKLLCAIGVLKDKHFWCKFSHNLLVTTGRTHGIQKTHSCGVAQEASENGEFPLFVTDLGNCTLPNPPIVTQDPKKYFKRGFPYLSRQIRNQYKTLFSLSREETRTLIDYMRKFEPARRCCGFQMSSKYMDYLYQSGIHRKPVHQPHLDHYCAHKNTSQIEVELKETTLVKLDPSLSQTSLVGLSSCIVSDFFMRVGIRRNADNAFDIFGLSNFYLTMKVPSIIRQATTDEEKFSLLVSTFTNVYCNPEQADEDLEELLDYSRDSPLKVRDSLCR